MDDGVQSGKYAVAWNLNNKLDQISLGVASLKRHNPHIRQFGLVIGNISNEIQDFCKEQGVVLIPCDSLFDEKFPCFKEYGIDKTVDPGNKRKYSKYVFGRFLIPYIQELRDFDKVLYMDCDCLVMKSLDCLFAHESNRQATICNDGQGPQKSERKKLEIIRKYDKYGMIKDRYACSGVIMFNVANIRTSQNKYDLFMARIDEIQH